MSIRPSILPSSLWGEPLWDYSVRVYGHKEVENIVLGLQDEYHANVDIILWCCWMDAEDICLSKEALDDVLITIDTVSQATLLKLREVRRYLKEAGSFTQVQAKVISKQLVNAELMVEKVLIHRLQDLTRRFAEVMEDREDPLSLTYYLDFLMIPDARQIAHLIRVASRGAQRTPIT
ncbi:TIGR02444 family protein [Alteromonadaceae bacterium Bs31]|nr:TIGR02444 family protein [Alteromonadaceae bacterium Bs31]